MSIFRTHRESSRDWNIVASHAFGGQVHQLWEAASTLQSLVQQLVQEKEYYEFKPTQLYLKKMTLEERWNKYKLATHASLSDKFAVEPVVVEISGDIGERTW